jgi:hypothetical protein
MGTPDIAQGIAAIDLGAVEVECGRLRCRIVPVYNRRADVEVVQPRIHAAPVSLSGS